MGTPHPQGPRHRQPWEPRFQPPVSRPGPPGQPRKQRNPTLKQAIAKSLKIIEDLPRPLLGSDPQPGTPGVPTEVADCARPLHVPRQGRLSGARGQIVESCPSGAISWNEEKQIPQAWPFDAHLLDEGWTKTRGEQACPTQVFRTIKVEDEEMQRIRAEEGLEVLKPELDTKPRIYYKNLHMITKCFVGGTVVQHGPRPGFALSEGVEECATGVEVVLEKDGREVGRATTDTFDEFVIDRLEPNSSGYHLKATSPSGQFSTQFDLADESRYLGVMALAVE